MERPAKKVRVGLRLRALVIQHWPIASFLIFFFCTTVYKLIAHPAPFYDWDESIYVQAGREMVQHLNFVTPFWQGKLWFDKPPLISLVFGLISLLPIQPEISTRLFVLIAASLLLLLLYVLFNRVTKNTFISSLAIIATCYSPIFLQRSQVVSLDIFLLLGWVGFFVFYNRLWVSTFFLILAVQSKSLLGFYPLGIYAIYLMWQYFQKTITLEVLIKRFKIIAFQAFILSLWYVYMLYMYGAAFWNAHIIESHFRRVTSSLESHFGQRTFYIDLMREQLGILTLPALLGTGLLFFEWLKKRITATQLFIGSAIIPWFLFLNLTKTKIAWYLYPAIPQFFLLAFYPLTLLRTKQKLLLAVFGICLYFLIRSAFVTNNFFSMQYSSPEPHILLSQSAPQYCTNLSVLVSPGTRTTFATLKKLGLTITTTDWWGDHPSMVYYFNKPLTFFYDTPRFSQNLKNFDCLSIYSDDVQLIPKDKWRQVHNYKGLLLYKIND